MDFDDVFTKIGGFGRYQVFASVSLAVTISTVYLTIVSQVFTLASPPYTCIPFGVTNATVFTAAMLQNLTLNSSDLCTFEGNRSCREWQYDTSQFYKTVVTEFDWVCEKSLYRSYAITVFMIGMCLGTFLAPVGDYIGRKKTLYIAMLIKLVSGLCVELTTGIYSFAALQFITALTLMPISCVVYPLAAEILTKDKRIRFNIFTCLASSFNFMLLVGCSYLLRHWRYIQLVVIAPSLVLIILLWFVTESPRWLITRGRIPEAEAALRYIARVNGADIMAQNDLLENIDEEESPQLSSDRLWHIFFQPILACRIIILFFVWAICAVLFYGIPLYAGNLHGNIYLNLLFCVLAEFPPIVLLQLLVDRVGRKPIYCGSMLCGGLGSLATILPVLFKQNDLTAVTLTAIVIAKMGAYLAMSVSYLYTIEVFPTTIRAAGVAAANFCARMGSVIIPYIANMKDYVGGSGAELFPPIIFGVAGTLAGLLILMLPETMNTRLPETISDLKKRRRSRRERDLAKPMCSSEVT